MIKQRIERELVQPSRQVNKQVAYLFKASLNRWIRAVNADNARATCRISSRMLSACMTREQEKKGGEYSAGLALIALLLLLLLLL